MSPRRRRDAPDDDIARIGGEIAAALPGAPRGPGERVDRYAMRSVTNDAQLRAALFRFVDVMPALGVPAERGEHLASYLVGLRRLPLPLAAARRAMKLAPARSAIGATSGIFVRHLARRFIVGETPEGANATLRSLAEQGIDFSVDLLGESTVTSDEADRYARRCHEALDALAATARVLPGDARQDAFGPVPRVNLSVKVSALTPAIRPHAPDLGIEDARLRLRELFVKAKALGAHLHVDMESLDSRDVVLGLVFSLLAEQEFSDGPSVGVVVQAYLRDGADELDAVLDRYRRLARSLPLVVRLVKGAYFDHELAEAVQRGWSSPVFTDKVETDRNFEALTERLLAAEPAVRVAVGSHNLRSIAHAIATNRRRGATDAELELQVLRGLGDDLAVACARLGYPVRVYCPIGDLVAGMAYLVRRLLENTSNESFLRERSDGVPLAELLGAP